MVDYEGRNFNTAFSGLITTVAIMGAVGGCCLIGFETLRQMKRLPRKRFVSFWKQNRAMREGRGGIDDKGIGIGSRRKNTQEDWEMGHLYHARTFHATTPSPPLARWPLAWTWQALRLDDWFYATHCGMDNVVYVRFLRACVWWMFLHTLTTAPILLSIHFKFSKGVALTDMSRASLSYLVTIPDATCTDPSSANCPRQPNEQGRKLLWIHLCLTWYITVTWSIALWWIGKGAIAVRRRLVEKIKTDRQGAIDATEEKRRQESEMAALDDERYGAPMRKAQGLPLLSTDNSEGWRQRTLLVMNLPATMRDEASIRRYFEEFLRPDDASISEGATSVDHNRSTHGSIVELPTNQEETSSGEQTASNQVADPANGEVANNSHHVGPEPDLLPHRHLRSPIQTVVLVRKMNELSAMLARRQDILQQLEAAHIKLAQAVLDKVADNKKTISRGSKPSLLDRLLPGKKKTKPSAADVENDASETANGYQQKAAVHDLHRRLAKFAAGSQRGQHHVREREVVEDHDIKLNGQDAYVESVWEALADVPREILDPYQPVTSLSALFRGQKVPTIDYLLTKLNLLTALVAEMRARPPTEYEATSTAFVTLRDPRQARMVWRELNSQIVIKVRMAPEVKDLDWDRLMRTSFTGDLVRGFGVNAFFWAFTIFWCIPLQLITTALFSVKNLKIVVPGLRAFFETHAQLESFVSVTLPTVIVSLITMSIPELVFQISKRAQGFVTWSALYDQCLCRYWKFIVCNIVIFFCIGTTTVEAILQQIGSNSNRAQILDNIAFSFPTAAPFFVSYLILGLSLHSGFELLGFMVPILQHFLGANKATTPRARALKTLPRNFNRYYWLPFHILIMTIVFVFAILNPLIIPFGLLYLFIAMIVFKKNFAFIYYRRFNEKEGVIYFIRLFRFTLDGLITAQVVILIFFAVTDQQKAYIALTALLLPMTVAFKILGTKLWKSQVRAIEDDEANAICGIVTSTGAVIEPRKRHYGIQDGQPNSPDSATPLDARASGRYPSVMVPPTTQSRILNVWQRLHDSFHANGADRPSYLAVRASKGQAIKHPVATTAGFVAKRPFVAVNNARKGTKQIGHIAKMHLNLDKAMKAEAEGESQQAASTAHEESQTVGPRVKIGAMEGRRSQTVRRSQRRVSGKAALARGLSVRSRASDETPFLSGFEAVANHAPVPSEDAVFDNIYEDGEESMMSISREIHPRSMTPRANRSRSMKVTPCKARPEYRARAFSHSDANMTQTFSDKSENDLAPPLLSDSKDAPLHHRLDILGQHADMTRSEPSDEESESSDYEEEETGDEGPLVRPHARIRWDDTPNNQARYNNPFYSCDLDPFLWLPRDPLAPLDLCDTIEWHGAALVSSDGGEGKVGEWDEDGDEEGADYEPEDNATSISRIGDIGGDEEIVMGTVLAKRLEEEELVDEVADPAASLPKNVLDDYRKAIRRASGSQQGSQLDENDFAESKEVRRRASNLSASSLHSPAPSVRLDADRRFVEESELRASPNVIAVESSTSPGRETRPYDQVPPSASGQLSVLSIGGPALTVHSQQTSIIGSPEARRTHFAPDPERRRPAVPALVVDDLAAGNATGPLQQQSPVKTLHLQSPIHRRRATNASAISSGAASIRSAGTQGPRTVTMRQALQAEVLEEERRRSIRERLVRSASRKNSQSKRRRSLKTDGKSVMSDTSRLEEEDMPGEFGHLRIDSTIMARHERALSRKGRRVASSEAGDDGSFSPIPFSIPRRSASIAQSQREGPSDGRRRVLSQRRPSQRSSRQQSSVLADDTVHPQRLPHQQQPAGEKEGEDVEMVAIGPTTPADHQTAHQG